MAGHSKIRVSVDTLGGGNAVPLLMLTCEEEMLGLQCKWEYTFYMDESHTFRELAMSVAEHRQQTTNEEMEREYDYFGQRAPSVSNVELEIDRECDGSRGCTARVHNNDCWFHHAL